NGATNTDFDHVAHGGVAALGAAQHLDAHQTAGAAIVGGVQQSAHLDHRTVSPAWVARLTTFTRRQLLWRDSGRHSSIATRSPSRHSPFSSCASSLVVRRWYFP